MSERERKKERKKERKRRKKKTDRGKQYINYVSLHQFPINYNTIRTSLNEMALLHQASVGVMVLTHTHAHIYVSH